MGLANTINWAFALKGRSLSDSRTESRVYQSGLLMQFNWLHLGRQKFQFTIAVVTVETKKLFGI